jgi:hypothetical protein
MFNDMLGGGPTGGKLDGRTEKRRQRLLKELEENQAHGQKDLKPLDILQRVQELLELGETVSAIKKARKIPKSIGGGESTVELIHRLHNAYAFKPECYRFVGITDEVLGEAGVLPSAGKRRRRAS